MKKNITTKNRRSIFTRSSLLAILVLVSVQCNKKVVEWEVQSEQMVISDYVISDTENFSEFGELLDYTGIDNLLRVRGPFTLLLPTDEAMLSFYEEKSIGSFHDLDDEYLEDLVYNHIFQGEITSGSIGQGTMLYKNGLGDYVASDFSGIDILINKTALIIKRDILTANGYVHHIDHVLEPVNKSVYDIMDEFGGYSIFLDGLDRAGLKDTLRMLDFPYGNTTARNRYTMLAVPDTLYNRFGITSVEDLISEYSTGGDLTDSENAFYKYMEYHCLSGTHYFNELEEEDIYHLISYDNYLSITVDDDYKVNVTEEGYTGFYYELSNIPAKNGTIHTVNSLLEETESEPATFLFQTTDYFDLQQGPYYLNYYQRFYDGQNTFEGIKWEADFLLYYLKPAHYLMDDDCLNLNGHFSIEITVPKVRKGEYDLSGFFFMGSGYAVMSCYLDGEYLGEVDLTKGTWGGSPIKFGRVNFTDTREHKIKLVSIVPDGCFWDYVKFSPVKD